MSDPAVQIEPPSSLAGLPASFFSGGLMPELVKLVARVEKAAERQEAANAEDERINAIGREFVAELGTLVERMRVIERNVLAAQAMARADREFVEMVEARQRRRSLGMTSADLDAAF